MTHDEALEELNNICAEHDIDVIAKMDLNVLLTRISIDEFNRGMDKAVEICKTALI
jgi:hypothetical protein